MMLNTSLKIQIWLFLKCGNIGDHFQLYSISKCPFIKMDVHVQCPGCPGYNPNLNIASDGLRYRGSASNLWI